jgi:O-antigen/teichoic acid export membrane protein
MRWNIIFNYASRLFSAFSTFLFIPIYISVLGADGYSVIALSILIASLILILEIGLTAAIGREMARKDVTDKQRRRAFVAIERLFLVFFALISVISLSFSDAFVFRVIGETPIDMAIVATCVSLIGMEAGLQLLFRFHLSVLIGRESQVKASLFNMLWAALRNGVVIIVIWVYPHLYAFFSWQLAATFVVVLALKLHSVGFVRNWSQTRGPILDLETLRRLRGFAGGMLLISLVAVANTQLDKFLVGSQLSLLELGAYTLAASLGTAMLIGASPIMMAVQPRLTHYFTLNKPYESVALFRKSTRAIALLVIPVAVIIAMNPEAVLNAWIADPEIVDIAAPIVPFLVIANVAVAISTITHAVALANGYTKYSNAVGICSLLISVPGYVYALNYSGVLGVAFVYLAVQVVSTLTLSWLLMNKFLGGGFLSHHIVSYAVPIAGSLFGAWVFEILFGTHPEGRFAILFWLIDGVTIVAISGTALALSVWELTKRWQRSL